MFRNYFKIAFRTLLQDKTYASLNIFGLALGLTCGLLIFLFVSFHLSTDTFHPHANRTYRVVMDRHSPDGSIEYLPGSAVAMGEALQNYFAQVQQTAFCMIFLAPPTLAVSKPNNQVERFLENRGVAYANTGFSRVFSLEFLEGNQQTALAEPNRVVLTQRQAQKYFGTTRVLGKIIRFNNTRSLKVTGVVKDYPPNTDLKIDVLISLPTLMATNPDYPQNNLGWGIGSNTWTFLQLPENYDYQLLDAQLPTFVRQRMGKDFSHWHFHLQPLAEMHFDERYGGYIRKPLLWGLCLIGGFLVLIACINFINLATAQALRRAKEVGIRKVLGGTRTQVFWQFMGETTCITLLATGLAMGATTLILPLLSNWLRTPLSLSAMATPASLFFIVALVLSVIFMAGFYPALILAGFNPALALKGNLASRQVGGFSMRRLLVGAQLIISQVLIIGALVVMVQMDYFRNADMGFQKEAIVAVQMPKKDNVSLEAFRNYLMQMPEVRNVSFHWRPPATDQDDGGYVKFDHRDQWEPFMVRERWGDAHYLEVYGLKLVAGRNIIERDSTPEMLVNEEFIKKMGFSDPSVVLGKTLLVDDANITGVIVGVVRNFHHNSLQNPLEPCVIYAYPPTFRQAGIQLNTRNLSQTLRNIQSAWVKTFPDQVFEFEFVDEQMARLYEKEAVIAQLIRLFTGVAVLICCLGFYGLVLFMAGQKTKEIGIRKVLGASVGHILLLFGREFATIMLISFLVATPVAWWIMNEWLRNFAFRIRISWALFALDGALVITIVLFTVSYQSIKAALANPVKSLRSE